MLQCEWCGDSYEKKTGRESKYCTRLCMRAAVNARKSRSLEVRCVRCGEWSKSMVRIIYKADRPPTCRACSSRLGQFARRGKAEHWCAIYSGSPQVRELSEAVVRHKPVERPEPVPIIQIACQSCKHGQASSQAESGWLCQAQVAARCQPWGARSYWTQA